MNFSEFIYTYTNIQLPTSEPLNGLTEGLRAVIQDSGRIISLDELKGKPKQIGLSFIPTASDIQKRALLFKSMVIKQNIVDLKGNVLVSNVPSKIQNRVNLMIANKQRYIKIATKFANPIKWYHIALIAEMECSQNFNCYLGNGQIISRKTTIVPKGRGPFSSFELGAIDAIRLDKLDKVLDWSIGNTLFILEGFNGYGYSLYKGINSPYLWSGSNNYVSGKYIADGVYSKTAVSNQIGIALLIKRLSELGEIPI